MVKLDHLGIAVRDWVASRDWYVTHIGLTVEFETAERGVVGLKDAAGFTLILYQSPPAGPAPFMLYFQVDDVEATYRTLTAKGLAFVHGPMKVSWGYGTELLDPNGYRIGLWDDASMREKGQD
jgi:predicted enzyme related to lactoylglutathione lyase